jgi:hypothetical protein
MKYPITKKSIMSKVALFGLVIMTSSYAYGTPAESLNILHKYIYIIEKKISAFFNQKDDTLYEVFDEAIGKDVMEYTRILNSVTRSPHDKLATSAHEVAEIGRQLFSPVYDVIRKYANKKSKEQVNNFITDLKRVFDHKAAFNEIICKLEALKKVARSEGEDALVIQITTIIKTIEHKKKEWNDKSNLSLLTALLKRMDRQ